MDIGLLRPATITQVITYVVKVMDMGFLITDTLPQVIAEVVDVGQLLPATLPLIIVEYVLIYMDLGHNRPANIPLAIG